MKVNDIYKWRYTDEYLKGKFAPYHCKERLAIVGKLKTGDFYLSDLYWASDRFGFYPDDKNIVIEYYCNMDELKKCPESNPFNYYNVKDIYTITSQHGCCNSCVHHYIKKDTKKDKDVIKNAILRSVNEKKHKIEYIESDIRRLERYLIEIDDCYETVYII